MAWHDALTFVAVALLIGILVGWKWGYDYAWHRRLKARRRSEPATIVLPDFRKVRRQTHTARWAADLGSRRQLSPDRSFEIAEETQQVA
jgi:hypothetical protein